MKRLVGRRGADGVLSLTACAAEGQRDVGARRRGGHHNA